jgi:V/A-type H+-transporting ATPase subunit C
MRAKTYGATAEQVEEDLVPAGSLPIEFLRELVTTATLDNAFNRLDGTIYSEALDGPASEVKNWAAWEDRVSRIYYTELLQSVPPSTDANRLMRQFIEREIDIVNLKTLLRVWAAKAAFDREIFLPGGYEMTEAELAEMMRLDKAAIAARLRAYSFYEDIAGDLEQVEATGVGVLLRKVEKVQLIEATKYSHLHPLSILPILDYILRKDREVQNIRLIARGKESGLSTAVIRELLVV